MVDITGSCLCGAVRYRSTADPITARACWCRVCQYLGAGGATVNVGFRTETFTIEGELKDFPSVADSGNHMHRRFCPTCGVQMFSEAEARPHMIFVRAGTLDNRELMPPSATIWTAQAPSWAPIDPDIPRLEGQPPP